MIKKLLLIMLMISTKLLAQENSVELTVNIINPNSDSIVIHNKNFKTTIKKSNGRFTSTFNAPEGLYQYFDGEVFATLYLRPGFKLTAHLDEKHLYQTMSFTGVGAAENNFLVRKKIMDATTKKSFAGSLPSKEKLVTILNDRLSQAKILLKSPEFDPRFNKIMLDEYEIENHRILAEYETVSAKVQSIAQLAGMTAPNFNYENITGSKTALSSLKGNYVFVDIWATWCAPCQTEVPYLKKAKKRYQGKNIKFVSVSIDEEKDVQKWKTFLLKNKLGGLQLRADKDWKSEWIKAFLVDAIPRFILIAPDGKIIDPDAPRPSSAELYKKLNDLLE
ncbi:MAG: TlpA family protein disulfide reductase [Chryseobacterium sp.]|nr:MAG: TlpA family protein disulfide reductase [Chryseobacterium sp.]